MNNRTVTPDQVLDMLRTASMALRELAREFWVDQEALHAPIAELLSSGRIRVGGVREVRYILVKSPKVAKERLNTPIAAARTPPPLKSNLVGYDAEIARHRELAMMVRREG